MMKYISFVGVLAIASTLLPGAAMAAEIEIVLEAELANKIEGPMVVAVPEDVKPYDPPVVPDEPSNGKFIWAPSKPVTGGPNDHRGFAEFIIDIPKDGTYAIWGRVIAWDGNSDSFWVTWEPADPAENPQATQNTQYRWATDQGPAWHWVRVNQWLNAGTFDRQWEFDKGETKLRIWTREDATMLDCLFITDNLAALAGDMRLPEDEDRKLQIEGARGKAVEAAGKLSTTWGRIRSEYH